MKEITFKEAKDLSLKKWEYLKDHTDKMDEITEIVPELADLSQDCGMCVFFLTQHDYNLSRSSLNGCYTICPVAINGEDCLGDHHPFNLLKENNSIKDQVLATEIYDTIKKINARKFLRENPQFKKLTSKRDSR